MQIEDYIEKKIYEIANCILNKFIKPTIKVDKVTQLNEDVIDEIKEKYGIEGMILDIDETIRKNMKSIPTCNEEWVNMIKTKLKVIVVTNGIDGKIEEFMKSKGIECIGFAHKPLKMSFKKACQSIDVNPENVLVVGDSLWSDIYGGNRNCMKTVLVKDVEQLEEK